MSGYDYRNKRVFSFRRNVASDGADWTSSGRLFQSRGPAMANERSPTVTHRDGRKSLEELKILSRSSETRPERAVSDVAVRRWCDNLWSLQLSVCPTYTPRTAHTGSAPHTPDSSETKSSPAAYPSAFLPLPPPRPGSTLTCTDWITHRWWK